VPDAQLVAVQPVESLVVPAILDGRDGTNRGDAANSQLSATNDLDAVRAWLSNYASPSLAVKALSAAVEAEQLLIR